MKTLRRRVEKFNGLSIGLDLHQKFIQYSVLASSGDEIEADRIPWEDKALEALVKRLGESGQPLRVALEASNCFLWIYDLLKNRLGEQSVKVAAPSKVKAIAEAGEKTDASDAWWLAYLAQEGRLPEAFVAEGDLRELRLANRELRSVTDQRSNLMRRLRSHLAQLGRKFPASAWSSEMGRAKIESLVREAESKARMRGEAIARLWSRIQAMSEEVAHWQGRVEQYAAKFEEVALLGEELPGVGPMVASTIWSETGDPRRYRSEKAYAKGTGLTPGYRESGGRRTKKEITREGSSLARWAFTRAIIACMRITNPRNVAGLAVKQWVNRMAKRKSKKAAIVAAARKLAEATWRLFALGEAFDLTRCFGAAPAASGGRRR
jgi:transposase